MKLIKEIVIALNTRLMDMGCSFCYELDETLGTMSIAPISHKFLKSYILNTTQECREYAEEFLKKIRSNKVAMEQHWLYCMGNIKSKEENIMQSRVKKHINTELFIELIQGALEEEGFQTKRYSDGNKYTVTSAYDAIMVKGADGNYYELTVSECYPQTNDYKGKTYNPAQMFEDIDK